MKRSQNQPRPRPPTTSANPEPSRLPAEVPAAVVVEVSPVPADERVADAQGWSASIARAIANERRRVKTFDDAQRLCVQNLEAVLLEQIQACSDLAPPPTTAADNQRQPNTELVEAQALAGRLRERVKELATERDELDERLRALTRASIPSTAAASSDSTTDDLRRQLAAAQRELRALHERPGEPSSDVSSTIAGDRSLRPHKPSSAGDAMDWESQKRRMLMQLEAEQDTRAEGTVMDDPAAGCTAVDGFDQSFERADERLSIDEAIQITDAVIAEKDREIAHLQQLLRSQSQNVGELAVGAAALGQVFDSDEIIRHERQRLAELQVALETRLRDAEIELSQERAKIARDRAEIEEQRVVLEVEHRRQQTVGAQEGAQASTANGARPQRRWLTRLGLKECDTEG